MAEPVFFQHFQVEQQPDGRLHELGRGAMGITYKAFDMNLQCPVALKIINAALTDNEHARERFLREARAAARLRHPNVATVLHLGKDDRSYFYAMEFIDGETLEAFVARQGPLAPALALEIVQQVARALGAAQNEGLVHRDIKPANLMLARHRGEDDEEGVHVKVIDFGLAKFIDQGQGSTGSLNLTMAGGFVGSPYFASPEQVDESEIDTRSDIYSLGATLWYLLTGEPPFTGSLGQVLAQHLQRTPPFEKLEARDIPAAVVALLRRLLAKSADDRPSDPAVLRRAVAATLRALGAPASSGSTGAADGVLATHYLVLGDLGENESGHAYRAQDRRSGQTVNVTRLFAGLLGDRAMVDAIEGAIAATRATPVPGLVAIHALERMAEGDYLVTEPVVGFSLLELMRARGKLAASEAALLLRRAADAVDAAAAAGVAAVPVSLRNAHVHFPGAPPGEQAKQAMLGRDVAAWPSFELKLDAIELQSDAAPTLDGNARTMLPARPPAAVAGGNSSNFGTATASLRRLAELVYEMLGGTLPAPGVEHYPPLTNLSENGNAVLRRVLAGGGATPVYRSARGFAEALTGDGAPNRPPELSGMVVGGRQPAGGKSAADTVAPPLPSTLPPALSATPPPPIEPARASATPAGRPGATTGSTPGILRGSDAGQASAAARPNNAFPSQSCLVATGIAAAALVVLFIAFFGLASFRDRHRSTNESHGSDDSIDTDRRTAQENHHANTGNVYHPLTPAPDYDKPTPRFNPWTPPPEPSNSTPPIATPLPAGPPVVSSPPPYVPPNGLNPIATYRARLSQRDHLSSTGGRLDNIPDILRQDRANYHRFNARDPEDEDDPIFGDLRQRARFDTLTFYGGGREAIVNGTPLVRVDVYPRRVLVTILSR